MSALVKDKKETYTELEGYLQSKEGSLAKIAASTISVPRMISLALGAAMRTPQLLQCTPESWIKSLMDAAYYGIEPNAQLGHAYILPYKNKKNGGKLEAQFMIGYKGLILLAVESGHVDAVQARSVIEGDHYVELWEREWEGRAPFEHHPSTVRAEYNADLITHVYAIVRGRVPVFYPLKRAKVEYYRAKSRAANSGPWTSAWEAMAHKTVIKRALEQQPIKPGSKLGMAMAQERSMEEGTVAHVSPLKGDTGEASLEDDGEIQGSLL